MLSRCHGFEVDDIRQIAGIGRLVRSTHPTTKTLMRFAYGGSDPVIKSKCYERTREQRGRRHEKVR